MGPAYFETMGTRLVAGRAIGERDTETAPLVSVINEAMAARYWQTSDRAIGRRFKTRRDGPGIEVMSVAKNGKYMSFGEGATPYYFVPLGQNYTGRVTVLVRSRESLPALMPSVRRQISGLDPTLPVFGARTMPVYLQRTLSIYEMAASLIGTFALMALLLADRDLRSAALQSFAAHSRDRNPHGVGRTPQPGAPTGAGTFVAFSGGRRVLRSGIVGHRGPPDWNAAGRG